MLTPADYREFSLRYLTRIAQSLPRGEGDANTPLILFGKGNAPYLEELAASGVEGVGVDWLVSLEEARRRIGATVALQGNLDPLLLLAGVGYVAVSLLQLATLDEPVGAWLVFVVVDSSRSRRN